MSKLVTTAVASAVSAFVAPQELVEARNLAVGAAEGLGLAERSAYGANRRYAVVMNDVFGFAWFTFTSPAELKKVSPEFAAEKDAFYAAYRAVREVSNMSKIWGDIKKYGEEDARARGLFGFEPEVADEVDGGESESNGAGSAKRSPDLFILEEMTAAFKRLIRDDALCSDKAKVFRGDLLAALKRFGVTGLEG